MDSPTIKSLIAEKDSFAQKLTDLIIEFERKFKGVFIESIYLPRIDISTQNRMPEYLLSQVEVKIRIC